MYSVVYMVSNFEFQKKWRKEGRGGKSFGLLKNNRSIQDGGADGA